VAAARQVRSHQSRAVPGVTLAVSGIGRPNGTSDKAFRLVVVVDVVTATVTGPEVAPCTFERPP